MTWHPPRVGSENSNKEVELEKAASTAKAETLMTSLKMDAKRGD